MIDKQTLKEQLSSKLSNSGLLEAEMDLFIQDVLRILEQYTTFDIEKINNRLHLLGWNHETDYATIQLISASIEFKYL